MAIAKTGRGARIKAFFQDARLELKKVIWPSWEDVSKMTGLVVAVVLIVGLFIFFWDKILVEVTKPLFPQ